MKSRANPLHAAAVVEGGDREDDLEEVGLEEQPHHRPQRLRSHEVDRVDDLGVDRLLSEPPSFPPSSKKKTCPTKWTSQRTSKIP